MAPKLAAETRNLMKETVKCTEDWDDEIPAMLRDKWLREYLNEFHRNRAVQIKRDVGTRPEKVHINDVLPRSRWQNKVDWMKMMVGQAIASGDIKAALEMRINDEEKDEFKDGVVYDKIPKVLTRGQESPSWNKELYFPIMLCYPLNLAQIMLPHHDACY